MDEETRKNLNRLNREFYEARGSAFDSSRDHAWPGWQRVIEKLGPRLGGRSTQGGIPARPLRVLDVGCGNARFAAAVAEHYAEHYAGTIDYMGVDGSATLLASARARIASMETPPVAEFARVDFVEDAESALPAGPFDLIVLFGVLHHVPGQEARRSLLESLAARVAVPGVLALTAWRFADRERFAATRFGADEIRQRTDLGIDPDRLERGDSLLGFGGKRLHPRYCHHADDDELDVLEAGLPIERVDQFLADGRSGDLNAYRVYAKRSS